MNRIAIFVWNRTLWNPINKYVYKDTPATLAHYKEAGYRVIIFAQSEVPKKLKVMIEHYVKPYCDAIVVTTRDIETARASFHEVLRNNNTHPEMVTVIASDYMLLTYPKLTGATTVWVKRSNIEAPTPELTPDFIVGDLGASTGIIGRWSSIDVLSACRGHQGY